MLTMQSINEFLTEDHGQLDALLERFQEYKVKDVAKAKECLTQFVAALYRHLQWEEVVLFPLFDQKSGQTGLTQTLLGEHQEIREWLKALSEKIEEYGADSAYEEKMLVEELGGHNAREEYALYPELDELLSGEAKSQAFEAMARLDDARR